MKEGNEMCEVTFSLVSDFNQKVTFNIEKSPRQTTIDIILQASEQLKYQQNWLLEGVLHSRAQ